MGPLVPRAPGLYFREVASEPSEQFGAIAGFVGIAERGPLHRPQPVQSPDEFLTIFGGPVDYAYLPDAVLGFFRNGGKKCFVVRVADLGSRSESVREGGCPRIELLRAAGLVLKDCRGNDTLAVAAINEGRWGNGVEIGIDDASLSNLPLTSLSADADRGATTLQVASCVDLAPGMEITLIPPDDPFGGTNAEIALVDPVRNTISLQTRQHEESGLNGPLRSGTVLLGRGFRLTIQLDGQMEVFDNLSISPDHARYVLDIVNGTEETIPYRQRQALGYSVLVRVIHLMDGNRSQFRPAPVARMELAGGGDGTRSSETTIQATPGDTGSITLVARADPSNSENLGRKGNAIRVRTEPFTTGTALAAPKQARRVVVENADGFVSGDPVTFSDALDPAQFESATIETVGADNAITLATALTRDYPLGSVVSLKDRFTLLVFRGEHREPVEVHHNLSCDSTGPRYLGDRLRAEHSILCGYAQGGIVMPPADEVILAGGRDPGEIAFSWYTGYERATYLRPADSLPADRFGIATLENEEEIDLVAIPDLAGQAAQLPALPTAAPSPLIQAMRQVLRHAAACGDRVALLDMPAGTAPTGAPTIAQQLAEPLTAKFGALYYPWLEITNGELQRLIPPSGFIAGVIARAAQEAGVSRAPANYPLNDVVDLELLLDQAEQHALNSSGINCIRKLEKPAVELLGARTLSSDPASYYLNTRRVVIAVKKMIGRALTWAVFEPNGPVLWERIRSALLSQMQALVAGGATATATGKESFFVKCDAETNPPEVSEAGQVIATVGIAPTAPAEFIILNVTRMPGGVSVSEAG